MSAKSKKAAGRTKDPYQERRGPAGWLAWLVRLLFLFVAVVACVAAGVLLYTRWIGSAQTGRVSVEAMTLNA